MAFMEGFAQAFKPAESLMAGFTLAERQKDRELKEAREKREQEKFKYEIENLQNQSELNKMMLNNKKVQNSVVKMNAAMEAGDDEAFIRSATSAENYLDNGVHPIGIVNVGAMNDEAKAKFFSENPALTNQQNNKFIARVWDDNAQADKYVGFKSKEDIRDYYASQADPDTAFKRWAGQKAQAEDFNTNQPVIAKVTADGARSFYRDQMIRGEDGKYMVKRISLTPEAAAKYDPSAIVETREEATAAEAAKLKLEAGRLDLTKTRAEIGKLGAETDYYGRKGTGAEGSKTALELAAKRNKLMTDYIANEMGSKGYVQNEQTLGWVKKDSGEVAPDSLVNGITSQAKRMVDKVESGFARDFIEAREQEKQDNKEAARLKLLEERKRLMEQQEAARARVAPIIQQRREEGRKL